MATGAVTRAKKRRQEAEGRLADDRISSLPDGVLGDIVSLVPAKYGARTQVLSSRWRHIWRSAPLNLDLHDDPDVNGILASDITRVLSAHPGPCRRFVMPRRYTCMYPPSTATMDGWLRSPVLDTLQELHFCSNGLVLPSVRRFSPTLCVASFKACRFPGGNNGSPLQVQLPLLKQLTLHDVSISESSLQALLASCPVLESLLLVYNKGFHRLQIVSSSLRSIGVHSGGSTYIQCSRLQELIIENAPCLERLLYFGGNGLDICVISAPRLAILGDLFEGSPRLQFGATVSQGSSIVSMSAVVPSVKVLALSDVKLCLDSVINIMQCFPHLQNLYIKITRVWGRAWCTDQTRTCTLDIGVRKVVLRNYGGKKSHINLASFFVSNARVLESMRFEVEGANVSTKWIERQQRLLQIENSASRGAQFNFVSQSIPMQSIDNKYAEQVHDLSADPFHRFH